MPRRTSTVVGREFGDGVRTVMQRTGLSLREIARLLGWDHPKLSDLVNGKGGVSEPELTMLLGLCRATPEEVRYLLALFHESRERGWLQLWDSVVPEQVRALIEQHQRAKSITIWSTMLVPGLLQIESYARAAAIASPLVPDKDVDALVAARMERRAIFEGDRQFTFYVYAPALTTPVGGPEVMADQLHDLLRMRVRSNITLRVVPAGPLSVGDFTVMKFERFEPVVYVESVNSGLFLDDKASIELHKKFVVHLDQIALSAEESRELITDIVT